MKLNRIKELAAGFAAGSLETDEQAEFRALLKAASPEAKHEASRIVDTAGLISLALPRKAPSASLKGKILSRIRPPKPTPELFQFIPGTGDAYWRPLRVPGAFAKLLSIEKEKGYAVVLGKLDPGTHYPAHHHIGPEQIYVLSGDLHIGEVALRAGDFHTAAAGSDHGINYSENGCTILAIVSTEDLQTLLPN